MKNRTSLHFSYTHLLLLNACSRRVKSNKNVTEGRWFPQIRMLLEPTISFLEKSRTI
ncbi:hypothetical protein Krac_9179 [Ktedonobacter racemifer DSM 44963]|uniref:Uncharacterized protein n=1 Tax=Ktedonobacter racemifer DSM 44963 TaxID=485913 RepID=D6TRC9_KTERA|nr:hypothetical protein Krac_9179 [Ktedonobacter racemifer DSM 44963]